MSSGLYAVLGITGVRLGDRLEPGIPVLSCIGAADRSGSVTLQELC